MNILQAIKAFVVRPFAPKGRPAPRSASEAEARWKADTRHMTEAQKGYHANVWAAQQHAIFKVVDGFERGVAVPHDKLVWLQLDRAAAAGTRQKGVSLGRKATGSLLGATVGVANPVTGRVDHFALAFKR